MVERKLIVEDETVSYEGAFEVKELYAAMKEWCKERGYYPLEIKSTEVVGKEGRTIENVVWPTKKFSDYARVFLRTKIYFVNIKDVEVERDGKKMKMQKGKVTIVFNSYLETDYEGDWEDKPVFFFVRSLFEKFVYVPYISGFEKQIKEETTELKRMVQAFLNLYRF